MSARYRHRRSTGPTSLAWLGMLVGMVLVGGFALTLIKKGMRLRDEREERRVEQRERALAGGVQPFADLEREASPETSDGAPPPAGPFEGVELAAKYSSLAWRQALVVAEEADTLYDACLRAKRGGRMEAMNENGRRARRRYDEALEATAAWEQRLIEEHGESDPGVREVMRTRDQWFDRLRWLHKSVAR